MHRSTTSTCHVDTLSAMGGLSSALLERSRSAKDWAMATATLEAHEVATRRGLPCACGSQQRIEVDVVFVGADLRPLDRSRFTASECDACGAFEVTR